MSPTLPSLQIFLPPQVEMLQRCLKLDDGRYAMALGVIQPFALHPPGAESAEPLPGNLWETIAQILGKNGEIDEGWPKARGEWLAFGHCHPPAGYTAWPVSARITVGELDKQLAIAQDQPQTHGFAPLPPDSPERLAHQGQHDGTWLAKRWPHPAADTDPAFFQLAPADQQRFGFWQGVEAILVRNMHPQHPDLHARIPTQRPRFFVHQAPPDGTPDFAELEVHAETLWLLPEAQLGLMIYRSLVPVQTPDGRDLQAFMGCFEAANSPAQPLQHYLDQYLSLAAPELAAQQQAQPSQLAALQQEYAQLSGPELIEKLAEQKALFTAMLQQHGTDDETLMQQLLATPQTRQFAQIIAQRNGTLSGFFNEIESLLREIEGVDSPQAASQAPQATLESLQPTPMVTAAQAPVAPPTEQRQAPVLQDPVLATQHRLAVQRRQAQGQSCAGMDLSQANLAGLDLAGMDFSGAVLSGANLAGAQLPGAVLNQAILQGARLDAANLAGCQIIQATLDQATLAGASLKGAVLDDSNCYGVNFSGADLTGISLNRTILTQAWMQQVHAPQLQAVEADFSHANLEGCNLSRAQLQRANFTGARMARIQLDDADCSQANFTLADLSHASLQRCMLGDSQSTAGSQWQNANLQQAVLNGASWVGTALEGVQMDGIVARDADFSDTQLDHAQLHQADLRQAHFDRARLCYAVLNRSNLMEASFNHADLSHCQIQDANLYAASFIDTVLTHTVLQGSQLDATILPVRLTAPT